MDYKIVVAVISVLLTLIGYYFYFRDIKSHKTKPHAYSWLVWSILTSIAFFAQIKDGAGYGAWITAVSAVISFLVFFLAITGYGEKNITISDKLNLVAALFAIVPWLLTDSAVLSVILVTIIDFLGFVPTIRKSIIKPNEETLIHYFLAGLKFFLSIIALDNYTITTWLYPASLVIANWSFIILLLVRRKQINKT